MAVAGAPRCELGGGWQPEAVALSRVVALLKASVGQLSNEAHRALQMEVDALSAQPEFVRYLSFVFAEAQTMGASVSERHMCSLVLLKATRLGLRRKILPSDAVAHVSRAALLGLMEESRGLRNSAVGLCAVVVQHNGDGLRAWPELIANVRDGLARPAGERSFSSAMDVLEQLCEECGEDLASDFDVPLNTFFPLLLQQFQQPSADIRVQALRCVNHLLYLPEMPAVLSANAESLLQAIAGLASDPNTEVREAVGAGLTLLAAHRRFDVLMPHMPSISTFMLQLTQDPDEAVAMQGCEFWWEVCHLDDESVAAAAVVPHVGALVPVLLKLMQYSEEEMMAAGDDATNDTSVPDRPQDVRPTLYAAVGGAGPEGPTADGAEGGVGNDDDSDDDDDDDDEAGGAEEEDFYSMWTVRRQASVALEAMSRVVAAEHVLPVLLPLVEQSLGSAAIDWRAREAAVTALGALARAYVDALGPHLPVLLPYLLSLSKEATMEAPLRISLFVTLAKYGQWVCAAHGSNAPGDGLVRDYVVALTQATTHRNKRVQYGACSSLARFAEAAGTVLEPYVPDMVALLVQAYGTYQTMNKKSMLDVLGTLFEWVPAPMSEPAVFAAVMGAVWPDFERLHPADDFTIDFLEFFCAAARAVGVDFGPRAKVVYDRSVNIIEGTLTMAMATRNLDLGGVGSGNVPGEGLHDDEEGLVDRSFMYEAVSLLATFADAFGAEFCKLVDEDTFLSLVLELLKDRHARQGAFELVGELAKNAPQLLRPALAPVVELLLQFVFAPDEDPNVVINAVWALGLIVEQTGPESRAFAPALTDRLVLLLAGTNIEGKCRLNGAITLGHVAKICPDVAAAHLGDCARDWFSQYSTYCDEEDADEALLGIASAVMHSPALAAPSFSYLAHAANSIPVPGADASPEEQSAAVALAAAAAKALAAVKAALQASGDWARAYPALSAGLSKELQRKGLLQP